VKERQAIVSYIKNRAAALRKQAEQLERDTFDRIVAMERARSWQAMAAELTSAIDWSAEESK
jgi:hypothetical protein